MQMDLWLAFSRRKLPIDKKRILPSGTSMCRRNGTPRWVTAGLVSRCIASGRDNGAPGQSRGVVPPATATSVSSQLGRVNHLSARGDRTHGFGQLKWFIEIVLKDLCVRMTCKECKDRKVFLVVSYCFRTSTNCAIVW